MRNVAILVAHPIDSFSGRIGLQRILCGFGAGAIDLVDIQPATLLFGGILGWGSVRLRLRSLLTAALSFFVVERFFQPLPAHFLRDEAFLVGVVGILVEKLHVFVGPRVAFTHELLVIVFVPLLVFRRLVLGRFERLAQ